jgi:hypothetical protein
MEDEQQLFPIMEKSTAKFPLFKKSTAKQPITIQQDMALCSRFS